MAQGGEKQHKVLITGTGRSGTTFLVELLTDLGMDTGIDARTRSRKYFEFSNAGLEHNLLDPVTPYIVKNPALCEELETALDSGRFEIDHVYVPIRRLHDAAASRADVGGAFQSVPGGLVGTDDPARQAAVLAERFHELVRTLVVREIPHTFLDFPRLVTDADYTRARLGFLVGSIPREVFLESFRKTARPALVHSFARDAPKIARIPPKPPSRFKKFRRSLEFWR